MNSSKKPQDANAGFTLVETMMAVLILTIVVGGIFSQINRAQTNYRVEGQKLDFTQQQREFIDQFTRDLHQAGYPTPASLGLPATATGNSIALGLTSISLDSLTMEGDLDGTGVQVVTYDYNQATSSLERTVGPKGGVAGPTLAAVQNVLDPGTAGVFTAYDVNGNVVNLNPAPLPLSQIKSVRITFTLQGGREVNGATQIQTTMTGMARLPNF